MKGCLAKFNDSLDAFLRLWPHLNHFGTRKINLRRKVDRVSVDC